MLELFLECMPEYNIDRPDGDGKPQTTNNGKPLKSDVYINRTGNTPLLLAYTKGNGDLCRALVS